MKIKRPWLVHILLATILFTWAGNVRAEAQRGATDLLLPYFEVGLDRSVTTVFDVVNQTAEPVGIRIAVLSNWGIEIADLETRLTLGPGEVLAADLSSWLVDGRLPGRTLSLQELRHAQAALGGAASPRTHRYYSTPAGGELMVGSVKLEVDGSRFVSRAHALWGNFFVVAPGHGSAQGETLVDATPEGQGGLGLCSRHAVRFYEGRGFDAGTELVIWSSTAGLSATEPRYSGPTVSATIRAYDEGGDERAFIRRYLEPLEMFRVSDLGLPSKFGWLEIETETGTAAIARYRAGDQYSASLEPYCLRSREPRIDLQRRLDGAVANVPPGPWVDFGQQLTWSYQVTNMSDVTLTAVQVTDSDATLVIRCPDSTLLAGQAMTCSASDVVDGCSYQSVGQVTAITAEGLEARHFDPGHYRVRESSAIDLQILLDGGGETRQSPGPALECGTVEAVFVVLNTGGMPLDRVTVTADDPGTVVTCPKDHLAAGESMNCVSRGPVADGEHSLVGRVTATSPCGVTRSAEGTVFYHSTCPDAGIRLEAFVNGVNSDDPPGPPVLAGEPVVWTYVVSNTGAVWLGKIRLTDDALSAIDCPGDALEAGRSMVCTADGIAEAGPNLGRARVTGRSSENEEVSDEALVYFHGVPPQD